MSSLKKKHLINLSILVYLVLLISVLQASKPMVSVATGMGDAHVRVSMVVNDTIQNHGVWPPTFFYILKFFIDHFGIYMGPRIFGISFFVSLSVCFYLLSNKISGSSKTAILASILFITSPFFSRYITFSLSELPFALFVVLGMLFLLDYKNKKYLFVSAIMFNIANVFRFDGLILLPTILVYIFKKSKKITSCLLFLLTFLSYPIYYFIQNYKYSGSFFYLINDYKTQTLLMSQILNSKPLFYESAFYWLNNFIINFNIPIFILGIISLIYFNKRFNSYDKFILSSTISYLLLLLILRIVAPVQWFPEEYLFIPILLIYLVYGKPINKLVSQFKFFKYILIAAIFFNLSKNYYFIVNSIHVAEISKQLKNIGGDCLYILNEGSYPFDKDEIMFMGNHAKYVTVSEEYYTLEDKTKYSCFILDNLANQDLVNNYYLSDPKCGLLYRDNRYDLITCN